MTMNTGMIAEKTWRDAFVALLPVFLLVGGVIGSAMAVTYGVFEYRIQFKQLQQYKKQRDALNLEWGQLLIEQQTFGATTQIGGRAVLALHMYSPPASDTVTLSVANAASSTPWQPVVQNSTQTAVPAATEADIPPTLTDAPATDTPQNK